MRRTKIICTIGPASQDVDMLKELLSSGMNVARLNFSHGSHEEHLKRINNIRQAAQESGIPVAIMLDTKGPEIRIGLVEHGKAFLEEGKQVILTTQEVLGTKDKLFVNYDGLPNDVKAGTHILIDDGLISLRVLEVKNTEIICQIENGGEVSDRKKINVPEVHIKLPGLTAKDMEDINFAVKHDLDFIAASFIRNAADVLAIRKVLESQHSEIAIISKIENQQGVMNIDEIIRVSDGIMVARGDLGVEIPAEEVPLVQKMLIDKSNKAAKPVITATQMLDSMIRNPRPTRAEASDVANAILDGSDAIMLSGETATGKYPVESIQTMLRIAERIEKSLNWTEISKKGARHVGKTTTEAISFATCSTASGLEAAAIITCTHSGSTARLVSKHRPSAPIIAVTPNQRVFRKLLLVWGVNPSMSGDARSTDELIETAIKTVLEANYIKNGDLVVITAGVPVGIPGSTNLIKVETVGEVLAKGTGIGQRAVTGRAIVAHTAAEAQAKMEVGDILVTTSIEREFIPLLDKAVAIITEEGGLTSPGAIVGISLNIPVIVGVDKAMTILANAASMTVDPVRGLIYLGYAKVK